jgi:hypothetical protein
MDSGPTQSSKKQIRVGFYDIEGTIGKGNFAVVKLARHRITKTEVRTRWRSATSLASDDFRECNLRSFSLRSLLGGHQDNR